MSFTSTTTASATAGRNLIPGTKLTGKHFLLAPATGRGDKGSAYTSAEDLAHVEATAEYHDKATFIVYSSGSLAGPLNRHVREKTVEKNGEDGKKHVAAVQTIVKDGKECVKLNDTNLRFLPQFADLDARDRKTWTNILNTPAGAYMAGTLITDWLGDKATPEHIHDCTDGQFSAFVLSVANHLSK
jgi:hypothetical protein